MKKVRDWVVTGIVVLIVSALGKTFVPAGFEAVLATVSSPKRPYPESSPLHQIVKDFTDKARTTPELMAYLKTAKDAEQVFLMSMSLAKNGLRKLDDASLEERMKLLSLILDHMDVSTCAIMVRGNPENPRQAAKAVMAALEQLDPQHVKSWHDLVFAAMLAQVRNYPELVVQDADMERAMSSLIQHLPQVDGERLVTVITTLESASDPDVCWMGKTLYKTGLQLNQPSRSVLARGFVSE